MGRHIRSLRSGWRRGPLLAALAAGLLLAAGLEADAPSRPGPAAYVIPVQGEINDILKRSMERRIDEALAAGARVLIFRMDTPGGLVTSALDMCRMIKNLPPEVRSVAWVNPQAYSAGAMISLACDEIVMSRSAAIGDCAPILISPGGGEVELSERMAAKAESPILQEFRDSAQANGYDLLLARAMVKWEEEVWWLEHLSDGTRRFVDGPEKVALVDTPETPEWKLVETFIDPVTGKEQPASKPIDRTDSLLTLSQGEAVAFGFATRIVADLSEMQSYLALSSRPEVLEITGWEHFAVWLNSPLVRGILFVIMLAGAYLEFQTPGLIIPGATAAIALVIFLAAPYAAGLANTWTLILLALGIVLIGVEIFVLPGFGIAGLLGILFVGVSLLSTFVPGEPGTPDFSLPTLAGTWDAIKRGVIVLASSTIIGVVGIILLAKYLPYTPLARGLVLPNPEGGAIAPVADPFRDSAYIGDVGVVTAALRPGGQARFGQDVVDVSSQGDYIEAGTRVQVIQHEGMRIVVRPLPSEEA